MAKDTRARILETTARLLQHRGYHGTSLSDIIQQSGAPRGSLYFHFPGGKDELVIEATRLAIDETTAALRESLAVGRDTGHGVRIFIESAATLMIESEYTFGCPVAPVILDASGGVPELADLCRGACDEWVQIVEDALVQEGVARRRANTLALLVQSGLEGLLLFARAYRDTSPIRTVAAELESILREATPRRGARRARSGSPAHA